MSKNLLKWKVAPNPTGRYRSFEHRHWPDAEYANGERPAAAIYCGARWSADYDTEYTPERARTGEHAPLRVRIACYDTTPWKWKTHKQLCATLDEAKALAEKFLTDHPELRPPELRK